MNGSALNTIPINGSPSTSSSTTVLLGGAINSAPINTFGINGGLLGSSGGGGGTIVDITLLEDITINTLSYIGQFETVFSAAITNSSTLGFKTFYQDLFIENINVNDILSSLLLTLVKEGIIINASLSTDVIYGLTESISLSGSFITKSVLNTLVKENINIQDILFSILVLVIAENISISHVDLITKIILDGLQESINSSSSLSSNISTLESLIANFSIATLLYTGYNDTSIETISLNETASSILSSLDILLENLSILLSSSNSIILLSSINEDLETNDILDSTANLSSLLLENIEMISIDHGGETYSGWVLSPETFAIWRYSNYDFNSIAILNRKTFLANSTGLFSMEGSLDEGSFIQSRLKTASLDFGTTNLKQVPEMYIGMNTDGEMVVAVTTDERLKVKYKLINPSDVQELQYVKIGKGLRGSIWQFELIDDKSTQTNLSHIEWLPIVFGRKRR